VSLSRASNSSTCIAPSSAGGTAPSPYDNLDQGVAAEFLKHSQALVQAQVTASNSIDTKLTSLFGQSITLSIATFAASTLPMARDAWLPTWAGIGLAMAGLSCAIAAALAAWGLRCSKWAAPGLRPSKLFLPSVIAAKPSHALSLIAWAYEDSAEENDKNLALTEYWHRAALYTLTAAPLIGVFTAGQAWLINNIPAVVTITIVLLLGLTVRSAKSIGGSLVRFRDMIRSHRV
jgi:hypothetical protein